MKIAGRLVILVFGLAVATPPIVSLEPPQGPKAEAMLDFNAVDLDGRRWNLSLMKERVTLLDLWGTWCLGCELDHRYLRDLYSRCHERGLDVLGIVVDGVPIAKLREYLMKKNMTWPQVYGGLEASDGLRKLFDPKAFPSYILVDRDGSVFATHGGPLLWENGKMLQKLNDLCGSAESGKRGPTPNPRLDAAHSGVTALAQNRKRRATGRARQAYR